MTRSEPKRRVAVDLMPVLPGGTNGGAKLLVMDLLEDLSRDWDITCFCQPGTLPEIADRFGNRVQAISVPTSTELAAYYDAQAAAKGPFAANFFPMQRVSICGTDAPAVSVVHDLQFADMPENFTPAELIERAAAFQSCVDHSELIVTVSHFTAGRIQAVGQIDGSRIRVIYNAPNSAPAEIEPAADAQLRPNGYFLYPANFWPHKNHRRLLEAYREYRKTRSHPLNLVLTGEPGVGEAGIVEALRNEPGIHVTGFLERTALQALMAQAAALVFPSRYEGFGMPLVEAMAAGIPITCSDAGSLAEVAGQAALLFDGSDAEAIASALARIADDSRLRDELVAAGQLRVTELGGISRMGEAYREALETAIASWPDCSVLITGVGQNGWAGPDVRIDLPYKDQAVELELHFSMPDWAPLARQAITISSEERVIAQKTLWPGQDKSMRLQLAPGESAVLINAEGSFLASDVMERPPASGLSYKLEAVSCSADGHECSAWPPSKACVSMAPAVLLLAIAKGPQEGLTITATCASQQPFLIQFLPEQSDDQAQVKVRAKPVRYGRPHAEAARIVLPPPFNSAALVPSGGMDRITFHANELAAPVPIDPCETKPGFSVIIPSFNQGRFIARTIDSSLQQDHVSEVLVLDGGSCDETLDVLASYGSHISWWSGKDGGQADAVNSGLGRAVGEYIAWINSDDTYAPGAFDRVSRIFADRADVGVVYGDADHVDEQDRFIETYPTAEFNAAELRDRCFISQPSAFFRREIAVQHGGLRPSLRYCLDYEFWLRLAGAGVKFERVPQLLAHSRMYAGNKTMGETLHAYFETADVLVRRMGHRGGPWQERFANVTADHIARHHSVPRASALAEARRLSAAIWP
jgi:glycosyltransferase involved in cell wall biosynthesis